MALSIDTRTAAPRVANAEALTGESEDRGCDQAVNGSIRYWLEKPMRPS
jgi:hypothetical protein